MLRSKKPKDSSNDVSDADSEVNLWGPVIALVISILVIPIIWLLIARWLGGPIVLTGDASGLLATIGGVMGAIFTVGGLVIALVAILTQISLKDRVDRVTKKAIQKVIALSPSIEQQALAKAETMLEEKYNTVLRLAVEQQVNQQIRGHLLLLDAEEAMKAFNWEKAEEITREALTHYPQVPKARSNLGLWMSEAIIYTIEQQHGINDLYNWVERMERQFRSTLLPGQLPPLHKAIDWLEKAVVSVDDPLGRCSAMLALLFGVRDGYQKMQETIKAMLQGGNILALDWLLYQPDNLIALLDGCKNAPDRQRAQKDILDMLGYTLPTLDEVSNSLHSNDENVRWLVIGQQKYWAKYRGSDTMPDFPVVVTITGGGKTEKGGETQGRIFYPFWRRQSEMFPPAQLINQLSEQFILVCKAPYWWVSSGSQGDYAG